jgi:hypothetical protein
MFHLLFQMYVANVLILMLYMFHTYIARVCSNVLAISVLYCNTYFHVASCKCLSGVTYVSYICCKCMFQMFHLLQTYVAFKCFVFQRYAQRVIGARPGHRGKGREPGSMDGVCSSLS